VQSIDPICDSGFLRFPFSRCWEIQEWYVFASSTNVLGFKSLVTLAVRVLKPCNCNVQEIVDCDTLTLNSSATNHKHPFVLLLGHIFPDTKYTQLLILFLDHQGLVWARASVFFVSLLQGILLLIPTSAGRGPVDWHRNYDTDQKLIWKSNLIRAAC